MRITHHLTVFIIFIIIVILIVIFILSSSTSVELVSCVLEGWRKYRKRDEAEVRLEMDDGKFRKRDWSVVILSFGFLLLNDKNIQVPARVARPYHFFSPQPQEAKYLK